MNWRSSVIFLSLFSIFLFSAQENFAQYNEVGLQLGVSRYKGELSPHSFDTKFIHFAGGIFFRHNWNRHWSWITELNFGKVSGDDARLKTSFEQNRNLNFYSTIWDLTPGIEFNFFPYETGNSSYPFTPYIFTGFSVFKFNPKSAGVELQPLSTEGQGLPGRPNPYRRISFAIPIGGGIKISLGQSVGIGLQVSARRTFTDYIDDVSTTYPDLNQLQASKGTDAVYYSDPGAFSDSIPDYPVYEGKERGTPSDKDWYLFGTFTLWVRMTSFQREHCKPFKRRRY
ncbi:hypothetical protein BH11BAC1_BH11BAC1_07470 [soil metagenome]